MRSFSCQGSFFYGEIQSPVFLSLGENILYGTLTQGAGTGACPYKTEAAQFIRRCRLCLPYLLLYDVEAGREYCR
jgi:hypothetical protein